MDSEGLQYKEESSRYHKIYIMLHMSRVGYSTFIVCSEATGKKELQEISAMYSACVIDGHRPIFRQPLNEI